MESMSRADVGRTSSLHGTHTNIRAGMRCRAAPLEIHEVWIQLLRQSASARAGLVAKRVWHTFSLDTNLSASGDRLAESPLGDAGRLPRDASRAHDAHARFRARYVGLTALSGNPFKCSVNLCSNGTLVAWEEAGELASLRAQDLAGCHPAPERMTLAGLDGARRSVFRDHHS